MTRDSSTIDSMDDMRDMPGACPYCSTPRSATFHYGPCPERNKIRIEVHFHNNGAWQGGKGFEEQLVKAIVEEAARLAY